MSGLISTVDVVTLRDSEQRKSGVVDICTDDDGTVLARINQFGNELVLRMTAREANRVASVLLNAADQVTR